MGAVIIILGVLAMVIGDVTKSVSVFATGAIMIFGVIFILLFSRR